MSLSGRPLPRYGDAYLPGRWLRSLLLAGGLYVALFAVVHAVLAFADPPRLPSDTVLLVLVVAPQVVLSRRRGADLGRVRAVVLAIVVVVATALGLWTMQPAALDESYSAWFLGAIAFDLLGLAVLGSVVEAWVTMGAVVALAVAWALSGGMSAADGVGLVVRHVATLLIGTLLVLSLRRNRRSFAAFQTVRLRRAAEEEAARARAASRRVAVEQVLAQAGPTLQAIADGRRLTDEDRRQLLVLEGALRDQIRTPALARGPLRDSLTAARRRGVDVMLMDEAQRADAAARARATTWLAARLDETRDGGFVGRLRDLGDVLRVSAVTDERSEACSFDLDATSESRRTAVGERTDSTQPLQG